LHNNKAKSKEASLPTPRDKNLGENLTEDPVRPFQGRGDCLERLKITQAGEVHQYVYRDRFKEVLHTSTTVLLSLVEETSFLIWSVEQLLCGAFFLLLFFAFLSF
jgi:hypothetical protein